MGRPEYAVRLAETESGTLYGHLFRCRNDLLFNVLVAQACTHVVGAGDEEVFAALDEVIGSRNYVPATCRHPEETFACRRTLRGAVNALCRIVAEVDPELAGAAPRHRDTVPDIRVFIAYFHGCRAMPSRAG